MVFDSPVRLKLTWLNKTGRPTDGQTAMRKAAFYEDGRLINVKAVLQLNVS